MNEDFDLDIRKELIDRHKLQVYRLAVLLLETMEDEGEEEYVLN